MFRHTLKSRKGHAEHRRRRQAWRPGRRPSLETLEGRWLFSAGPLPEPFAGLADPACGEPAVVAEAAQPAQQAEAAVPLPQLPAAADRAAAGTDAIAVDQAIVEMTSRGVRSEQIAPDGIVFRMVGVDNDTQSSAQPGDPLRQSSGGTIAPEGIVFRMVGVDNDTEPSAQRGDLLSQRSGGAIAPDGIVFRMVGVDNDTESSAQPSDLLTQSSESGFLWIIAQVEHPDGSASDRVPKPLCGAVDTAAEAVKSAVGAFQFSASAIHADELPAMSYILASTEDFETDAGGGPTGMLAGLRGGVTRDGLTPRLVGVHARAMGTVSQMIGVHNATSSDGGD